MTDNPERRPPGPIAGRNDPANSHIAAEMYETKRESAKAKVLAYLIAKQGQWIPAPMFRQVAGEAAERRMRELRQAGWPIESRPDPRPGVMTWQHRLIEREDDTVDDSDPPPSSVRV